MQTKITIHRGTEQIGGCVTEIKTDNARIFIDFGQELPGTKTTKENLKIDGLNCGEGDCDGVFFTHYHGDHIGMFKEIKENVPLYMGECSREIMLTIYNTLASFQNTEDNLETDEVKALKILNDDKRIKTFKEKEPVNIGDIKITPYSVDHSAYDAYMFLIETDDLTILHTGDFRNHGYRGDKLIAMINKYILQNGNRSIDVLITEGTMMSRTSEEVMSEQEMQEIATEYFKQNKYIFLICSSTNLDSLWSFYQASVNNGMRFYSNYYVYEQLKNFKKFAGSKAKKLYQFNSFYKVEFNKVLPKVNITQEQFMRERGFVIVINARDSYKKWIEKFKDLNPRIIYSMWEGYLDEKSPAYNKELADFLNSYDPEQIYKLHTSGHATSKCIEEVINLTQPKKAIIPIHTENKEGFANLNISDELKNRVKYLKDGEEFKAYNDELLYKPYFKYVSDDTYELGVYGKKEKVRRFPSPTVERAFLKFCKAFRLDKLENNNENNNHYDEILISEPVIKQLQVDEQSFNNLKKVIHLRLLEEIKNTNISNLDNPNDEGLVAYSLNMVKEV